MQDGARAALPSCSRAPPTAALPHIRTMDVEPEFVSCFIYLRERVGAYEYPLVRPCPDPEGDGGRREYSYQLAWVKLSVRPLSNEQQPASAERSPPDSRAPFPTSPDQTMNPTSSKKNSNSSTRWPVHAVALAVFI